MHNTATNTLFMARLRPVFLFYMMVFALAVPNSVLANTPSAIAGSPEGKDFLAAIPAGARISKIRVRYGAYINAFQITTALNGVETSGPVIGSDEGGEVATYAFAPGEHITRITGTYNEAEFLTTLVFHTNRKRHSRAGWSPGPSPYEFRVPVGSEFSGLTGRQSGWLRGVGIVFRPGSGVAVVQGYDYAPLPPPANQVGNVALTQPLPQQQTAQTQTAPVQQPQQNVPAFAPQGQAQANDRQAPAGQGQAKSNALDGYFTPSGGGAAASGGTGAGNAGGNAAPVSPAFAPQTGAGSQAAAGAPEETAPKKTIAGKWWRDSGNFTKVKHSSVEGMDLDGKGTTAHTGDYNSPEVYVLSEVKGSAQAYKVQRDSKPGHSVVYRTSDGTNYTAENASSSDDRSFTLSETRTGRDRIRLSSGTILDRATVPDQKEIDKAEKERAAGLEVPEKEPMNSSFMLANNPYSIDYNLYGYDIAQIDPWNLTERKVPKQVFDKSSGTNWYLGNKLIVPYGLHQVTIDKSGTTYSENAITNSKDYQKTVRHTAGASIGVPKAGSVGVKTVNERTEGMKESGNEMMAFGIARHQKMAFVLDRANIVLSDDFLDAVDDIKQGHLTISEFIRQFGTHYPHAVTYGAMAKSTLTFDNKQYAEWKQQSKEVSVEAKAEIKKVEGTGSYGNKTSTQEKSESGASKKVESFESVGGNGSWGKEGFQASNDALVPILLDLRPLHELLSPAFFPEDLIVQSTVRAKLKAGIDSYLIQMSAQLVQFDNRPQVMRITINKMKCLSDGGEAGNAAKYYGWLALQVNAGNESFNEMLIERDEGEPVEISCGGSNSSTAADFQKLIAVPLKDLAGANVKVQSSIVESDKGIGIGFDPDEALYGTHEFGLAVSANGNVYPLEFREQGTGDVNRMSVNITIEVLD